MSTIQRQREAMQATKFSSRTLASGMAYLDALEQAKCNAEARVAKLERAIKGDIVSHDASSVVGTE